MRSSGQEAMSLCMSCISAMKRVGNNTSGTFLFLRNTWKGLNKKPTGFQQIWDEIEKCFAVVCLLVLSDGFTPSFHVILALTET